jgi:hypothetical protein
MFIATAIVSALLAALLVFAAVRKLSHREDVVRSYLRAGVPEDKLNHLASILLAGAAGLLAGLAWAPLGIAASAGLVCYFLGAIFFHIRAGDLKNVPTPITLELLAILALVLRITT